MPSAREKVWGICVTFDPDIPVFGELVFSASEQLEGLVVVDNGSAKASRGSIRELAGRFGARAVFLESNRGLATALNIGIAEALAEGATDVLFLDHDSVPHTGMVEAMLSARRSLAARGKSVGATGPATVDSRTGRVSPFIRFGAFGVRRIDCMEAGTPVIAADFLITSGSLIGADVLAVVGRMDEGFFIDHVDTDWCLRAKAAGYSLFGVCGAKLSHRLGDDVIEVGFPVRRSIHLHSPVRIYYSVRNSLLLYFRPYAPLKWVVPDAMRLFLLIVFYCLFPKRRGEYFSATLRAVRDASASLVWRNGH